MKPQGSNGWKPVVTQKSVATHLVTRQNKRHEFEQWICKEKGGRQGIHFSILIIIYGLMVLNHASVFFLT